QLDSYSCCGSVAYPATHAIPTRRSSDLTERSCEIDAGRPAFIWAGASGGEGGDAEGGGVLGDVSGRVLCRRSGAALFPDRHRRRSEEHTSELQSRENLVCRLLLEKKKIT